MRFGFRAVLITLLIVVAITLAGGSWFVFAHPGLCPWTFRHEQDRRAALVAKCKAGDGLRIHEQNMRNRDTWFEPHDGRVLFETNDPRVTQEFLELIRIDDANSPGGCCCIGGTEIDVMRGGSVLTSFQLKHGAALRSGLLWPGDASLTPDSAEAVCAWLTARGVDEESPAHARARIAANRAVIDAQQDVILGVDRATALRAALATRPRPDLSKLKSLVADWAPDREGRIRLAVRFLAIFGLDGRTDDQSWEYLVVGCWVIDQDEAAVSAVLDRMLADDADARAVAIRIERIGWIDAPGERQRLEESIPRLRIAAAQRLLGQSDEPSREIGRRLLDLVAGAPDGYKRLTDALPRATSAPTPASDFDLEVAVRVAALCETSDLPRLRALAAAATDGTRWTAEVERRIAARAAPATSPPPADAPR